MEAATDWTTVARLAERAQLSDLTEAARAAQATTRVLSEHITEGELDDVFARMRDRRTNLGAQFDD